MINESDIEQGNRNLTSRVLVLTHTPGPSGAEQVGHSIQLGDGTNNLDGTGGSFICEVEVGGVLALSESITVPAATQFIIKVPDVLVQANAEVRVYVTSPNAADTNVNVTARQFLTSVAGDLDAVGLKDDAITASVFDEVTAFPLRSNTLNLTMGAMVTGQTVAGTLSQSQATTDLSGYSNDQLVGRSITFTSGNVNGESSDITDYDAVGGVITFTTLSQAPGAGVTFVIA